VDYKASERVGVALNPVIKALGALPAQIVAFAAGGLLVGMDRVGGNEEIGQTLFNLVRAAQQWTRERGNARTPAVLFDGSLGELMDAAALAGSNTRLAT
jgi:hypothetical protein